MQAGFREAGEVSAFACNYILDNQPTHNNNLEFFSVHA